MDAIYSGLEDAPRRQRKGKVMGVRTRKAMEAKQKAIARGENKRMGWKAKRLKLNKAIKNGCRYSSSLCDIFCSS